MDACIIKTYQGRPQLASEGCKVSITAHIIFKMHLDNKTTGCKSNSNSNIKSTKSISEEYLLTGGIARLDELACWTQSNLADCFNRIVDCFI